MKRLILILIFSNSLFSCKKETTTPATNSSGTTIDTIKTTKQPTSGYGPNITDVEGNSYKTVYIGSQQWMAENLKTSKYNNGNTISNVTDPTQWKNLTTPAWCHYNNSDSLGKIYGKLYNWYVVSPASNVSKNVCPTGWHVPTKPEWTILIDYLGGESIAGGKMKEIGTINWNIPNAGATNVTLFRGLPGGARSASGSSYFGIGYLGHWWSVTEAKTNEGSDFQMWYNGEGARCYNDEKNYGFSIRCLKD